MNFRRLPRSCQTRNDKTAYQVLRMAKYKEKGRYKASFWYPAATYLSGPSPAKYCRRIRA